MLYQKKKTRKKFYNKYPFKIALFTQMAKSIDYSICKIQKSSKIHTFGNQARRMAKQDVIQDLAVQLEPFFKDANCRRRLEGYHLNIFTLTKEDFDKILQITERYVTEVHEPGSEEDLKFFEENSAKKILTDKLPYGSFKYKIYIRHTMDHERRLKLANFVKKSPDNVKVSKQSQDWMTLKQRWVWAPYMFLKDSSSLTMISLFLGTDIKKIEEYVLREEIAQA